MHEYTARFLKFYPRLTEPYVSRLRDTWQLLLDHEDMWHQDSWAGSGYGGAMRLSTDTVKALEHARWQMAPQEVPVLERCGTTRCLAGFAMEASPDYAIAAVPGYLEWLNDDGTLERQVTDPEPWPVEIATGKVVNWVDAGRTWLGLTIQQADVLFAGFEDEDEEDVEFPNNTVEDFAERIRHYTGVDLSDMTPTPYTPTTTSKES